MPGALLFMAGKGCAPREGGSQVWWAAEEGWVLYKERRVVNRVMAALTWSLRCTGDIRDRVFPFMANPGRRVD